MFLILRRTPSSTPSGSAGESGVYKGQAWRDGLIVDLGRHNDTVMAFAHAIDQFTYRTPDMPVVMKTLKGGEWMGGATKGLPRQKSGMAGKVINRRWF